MKFIIFLGLNFALLPNPGISGTILTKTELLKKSNDCLIYSQKQDCKKLILHMEQLHFQISTDSFELNLYLTFPQ